MNRYFWVALVAVLVLAASGAAILLVDVSDPGTKNQLDLALKAIGVCASVATAVFTILGGKAKGASRTARADVIEDAGRVVLAPTSGAAPQSEAESLREYVAQMRQKVEELGWEQHRFVELTTTVEPDGRKSDGDALPRLVNLEWVDRSQQRELSAAEPEAVDLEQIPRRFRRVAMLGEPGSGKSTLLQQMAALELERLSRAMDAPGVDLAPVVPLYVSLSEWKSPSMGALEFLQLTLRELVGSGSYLVANFDTLLAGGRLLLLLDGLNELPRRRIQAREGQHEQPGEETVELLRGAKGVGIDPRERSLRDLAQSTGLRSSFVLACRSHEYLDSMNWQIIRVLPMTPGQIDRFLVAYVSGPRLDGLREVLQKDETLVGIATNPFFLRSIMAIYQPGMLLKNRGAILDQLSTELITRELDGGGDNEGAVRDVLHGAGSVAFDMLSRGEIGSQAAITSKDDERAAITTLLATGLVVQRSSHWYFLHQIVQEYFAARALCDGGVRRNVASLLTSKRWSEVVVLWSDLSPDRLHRRLVRSLRSRNLPWRRPRSTPGTALSLYQAVTSAMLFVVVSIALIELVFNPPSALPFLFGLVSPHWVAVLAVLLILRIAWTVLRRHSKVIVNTGYVLAATWQPAAIAELVRAFRALSPFERDALSHTVARFGDVAIPHLRSGLSSRRATIRGGCVVALGELLRREPQRTDVLDILLALVDAEDPTLTVPLVKALDGCQDERVPDALMKMFSRAAGGPFGSPFMLGVAKNWTMRHASFWDGERSARFEQLAGPDQPLGRRVLVLHALGGMGVPEAEQHLARVARDSHEPEGIRNAAVVGLGLAQSGEAIAELAQLGEGYETRDVAVAQLRRIRNPAALPAMIEATSSSAPAVREAAATSLGVAGRAEVLPILEALSEDVNDRVRVAVARALAAVNHAGAVPVLDRLSGDTNGSVRVQALRALSESYPDLAAPTLMRRARENSYPDRDVAAQLLGKHAGEQIETCLQELTGDPEKRVRESASAALSSVWVTERAQHTSPSRAWRHPLGEVRRRIATLLELDGLRALWEAEKSAGTPTNEIFNTLLSRTMTDAELAQRFRVVLALVNTALIVAGFVLALFAIVAFELAFAAAVAMLDAWPYVVALGIGTGLTYVPFVAAARYSRFGWLIVVLRFCGLLAIVLTVLGFIAYTWWIWLLLATAACALTVARYWRTQGRRRDRDVALVSQKLGAIQLSPT